MLWNILKTVVLSLCVCNLLTVLIVCWNFYILSNGHGWDVFSIVFQELSYLFNLIAIALDLEGKSRLTSTLTKDIGLIEGQFLDSSNPIFGSGVFQLLCAHLFLMYNIEYSPEWWKVTISFLRSFHSLTGPHPLPFSIWNQPASAQASYAKVSPTILVLVSLVGLFSGCFAI